jgi:hypothetical protein
VPSTADAVDAAAKTAAHDAIVVGFDAVAPSEVRNARRGVATSSVASPPRRMRNADHSVRAPSHSSTAVPRIPNAIRSGSRSMTRAAPSDPSSA